MDETKFKVKTHKDCPDAATVHTRSPDGQLQWHDWAAKKSKTHRQQRCPTCGFFSVWVPKEGQTRAAAGEGE